MMKCQGCCKEIIKKTPNQKWCLICCSNQRKEQLALPKKECPLCKEEFTPNNAQHKYCNKDCIKKNKNICSNSRWNKSTKKKPKLLFGYKETLVI